MIHFEKCKYSDIDYLYFVSCTLICTSILIIMLTLTMSHNSHMRSPYHSIPVILSCHLYVKHKTIVGNVVYIQFVILAIGITFSCLTAIQYL